jgi:hypothetical protein
MNAVSSRPVRGGTLLPFLAGVGCETYPRQVSNTEQLRPVSLDAAPLSHENAVKGRAMRVCNA